MKSLTRTVLTVLCGLAPASLAAAEDTRFEELPPVVQQVVEDEVGTGVIDDIDREGVPGATHYFVTYHDGNDVEQVTIAENGLVVGRRQDWRSPASIVR